MKKKAARRKMASKPATLPDRPLILPRGKGQRIPPFWSYGAVFEDAPRCTPRDGTPYWTVGTKILGIDVPTDLDKAISAHGEETYLDIEEVFTFEPWRFFDYLPADNGSRYAARKQRAGEAPLPIEEWEYADLGDPESWTKDERGSWDDFLDFSSAELMVLHAAINTAIAHGFYLALTRYADDLKHVPEARAMIDAHRQISKKGGDARRKEAEPRRQQARRLDRELRKEGGLMKKKTHRVERIAREMKRDTRTIERYLDPKRDKK